VGKYRRRIASDAAEVADCTASMWAGRSSRISVIGLYSSSLRIWPRIRTPASLDAVRAVFGSTSRRQVSAREIAKSTLRGKSRSSRRNSAALRALGTPR
jgi:hypothetical protein